MRNCQIRLLKTQPALELLLVAEDSIRVLTHLFIHASLKSLQLSLYVIFQYRGTVFVITNGRGRSSFLSSRNLKRNVSINLHENYMFINPCDSEGFPLRQ